MNFNKGRIQKLAGLLKEAKEVDEVDEIEEAEQQDESDMVYEIDEADLQELEESFDLRKAIRDAVTKSIKNRDEKTYEWTSGQVHGRRNRAKAGSITMGFPGIGFRR